MKKNLKQKFLEKIQEDGVLAALEKLISWSIFTLKHNLGISCPSEKRRKFLSNKLLEEFNGVIRYGLFTGLKFSSDNSWGVGERASMLLGLYEKEILTSLQNIPSKYKTFIDLGAADGYYGIGALVNGMFEKSYCYEMNVAGQKIIKKNAELNNVASKVVIRGFADKYFYKDLKNDEIDQSVLLVDIEGAEFNLFDKNLFKKFSKSIIYIELHPWIFKNDGQEELHKLENDAREYFTIEKITTTSRDLSKFEELKKWSDTDRWLICSEGRHKLMTWWRLDPL
jgi:hypothetical protein|tara:strand:+ start:2946 stop:3791 length:846 start_codon:yes stop_codon:yes gene_type:complete